MIQSKSCINLGNLKQKNNKEIINELKQQKSNVKNTYIKKINSLINLSEIPLLKIIIYNKYFYNL